MLINALGNLEPNLHGRICNSKSWEKLGSDSIEAAMAQLNLYKAVEAVIAAAKEGIISFAEGERMILSGLRKI